MYNTLGSLHISAAQSADMCLTKLNGSIVVLLIKYETKSVFYYKNIIFIKI